MAENCTTKCNGQISVRDGQVAVAMVPLSAQGHLNQLLHLSRLITSYNIPVHYVGATTHIRQAKFRVHGFDPVTAKNLHFHEFLTPPFENPLPNPNASNKFPNQLIPSFYASSISASQLEDVPAIPSAECYRFNSISAFHTFSSIWETRGKPFQAGTEIFEGIPSIENCATPELWEFWSKQEALEGKISSGELYNSSRKKDSNKRHQTLDWLDKQEPDSVIYVSFGISTSLSNEQIEQLAIGLEKSLQKFVWVLRDADKGDVFSGEERRARLPEGYEERLKGRGIIGRDWAPQLEILARPSTGGFMSHCGWNSCMESISMGVPIAAWPMHSDQPRNSQLVTKFLKISVNVRLWARHDELVTSDIVENAVRTLIDSPEGDEMRKRASELSLAVKQSVMDGGEILKAKENGTAGKDLIRSGNEMDISAKSAEKANNWLEQLDEARVSLQMMEQATATVQHAQYYIMQSMCLLLD
ncbi:hypothetical protein HAX54_001039 [Datura stramonium]|uniref:Glycosyltransferase n=1 Tax=Datura stramonium TaxID=4076 RepID=A0ABS8T2H3_DATST|nr:hypothetical protein [Datura stramonium]